MIPFKIKLWSRLVFLIIWGALSLVTVRWAAEQGMWLRGVFGISVLTTGLALLIYLLLALYTTKT